MKKLLVIVVFLVFVASPAFARQDKPAVATASKQFTESIILGDMLRLLAERAGAEATHKSALGGSGLVFGALTTGEIDAYVDYTGTLKQELLAGENITTDQQLRDALAERGIVMSEPLGFNNGYALGMKRSRAEELGIETLSDLRDHPDLVMAFSNEFAERADGWPSVRDFYGLPQTEVGGMDHTIAYRALDSGQADVTELYTTDAEIEKLDLVALEDDRGLFPRYDAVILYRADLVERAPEVVEAWRDLTGTLNEETMIALNAKVVVDEQSEQAVASTYLTGEAAKGPGLASRIAWRTWEHTYLVVISVGLGVLLSIPLGVMAATGRSAGAGILTSVGVLQTIPSLALLALLVTWLGTGPTPAIVALWLYSLLPMVRNTHSGLTQIRPSVLESADALGLTRWQTLTKVRLPLAMPSILAGIKTSAVITVGFATLGALINAGGYGQPILSGLRRLDNDLILEGAIPAALMALAVQFGLDGVGKLVTPRGLRA